MRKPAKWEIREFAKLVNMIDFLKEKYRPFTEIAREAVRRGIIKQSEVSRFYNCFSVCVSRIGVFKGEFFPSDQTPTGRDRWEWKLAEDITREKFLEKINSYVRNNFKTPLYSR
ncbi:MAG: hypothetical protein QXU46_04190 [Candidatus Bathyarchaeia archaeon]